MPLLSPIDGRYQRYTKPLADLLGEDALIRSRVVVEGEYLIALSEHPDLDIRDLTVEEKAMVRGLYALSPEDITLVKDIEIKGHGSIKATQHDVKAVEYFLREKLGATSLKDVLEWIHFGLTSEDVNNIAYGMMLGGALKNVILPALESIQSELEKSAVQYKSVPMLARTHGQPASPTTFGKEFRVFECRLARQIEGLRKYAVLVKLNGATGNYNAHVAAYPTVDWIKFSESFVAQCAQSESLPLAINLWTTQIEPHDTYAELFDALRRANMILIDLSQDIWRYISDGWIVQRTEEGEVGSSTMPHKVNPIKFENSEGNLGIANALLTHFSTKLPISRLQRDLSDSTVERNFGVALGHCLVAYTSLLEGLGRIRVDEAKVIAELNRHPEVIAEAIQTILRREGVAMPYEKLKALTRGKEVTLADLRAFVEGMDIPQPLKEELQRITPSNYIGIAERLADHG